MFEPEFGENDKGVPYKYQTISKKFVKSRDNGATYTKSVFSIYFVIFAEHVVVAMLVHSVSFPRRPLQDPANGNFLKETRHDQSTMCTLYFWH